MLPDHDDRAVGSSAGVDSIGAALPPDRPGTYPDESAILDAARRIAETALGPRAEESDRAAGPNPDNFKLLAEAGLLGIALPRAFGGLDASGATQREYTQILASYCGVTAFVQAQHHGSSRMIANGPSAALKAAVVPDLAAGRHMCAISFAHLRRPGLPVLRAEPVNGGFRLSGTAPWVTGWGLMDQVVFGATLPDGRFVYLWSPARRADFPTLFEACNPPQGDWGQLTSSDPLPLCAMNASATCELTLDGWFIPQAHWLSESDRETMQRNDRNGVLGATSMSSGCAVGAIRVLRTAAERRPIAAITRAAAALESEWTDLQAQIRAWSARTAEAQFFENAVRVRAWSIDLAMRATHAAVAANSGAANLLTNPAQRLLREAMFYTVQAQTQDVMAATLALLERQ